MNPIDSPSTSSSMDQQQYPPPSSNVRHVQNYIQNWAQTNYVQDSGFQSGGTSAAPSVISGTTSLHADLCNSTMDDSTFIHDPATPYRVDVTTGMFPEQIG